MDEAKLKQPRQRWARKIATGQAMERHRGEAEAAAQTLGTRASHGALRSKPWPPSCDLEREVLTRERKVLWSNVPLSFRGDECRRVSISQFRPRP